MIDEGYVKYEMAWQVGAPPDADEIRELNRWRRVLFAAGLIGEYRDLGIGYGNISQRCRRDGHFIISGTQTGHLAELGAEHYARVTDYDIAGNRVACRGPIKASSEAMTHAAIYELGAGIDAVVHVHSRALWQRHLGQLPTTCADVAYGTPEMAREFARLYRDSNLRTVGVAVMAGHDEGLVSFGHDMTQAASRILSLCADCASRGPQR